MSNSHQIISDKKMLRGFTLVEIMVVFALVGVTMAASIASFMGYGNSQTMNEATSDIKNAITDAKTRAVNQIKPAACGTNKLTGYVYNQPAAQNYYQILARCGSDQLVFTKKLPSNVTTTVGTSVLFSASTGLPTQSYTATITGYGKTKSVVVSTTGIITVQ